MKILWHANAPWTATGYGQQSRLFLPQIRDAGHNVAISQNHGYAGAMFEWEGMRVYPEGYDLYGNDVIPSWARDHMESDEGWIIALYDAWVFKNPAFRMFHMAIWAPVDHEPLPPFVGETFKDLQALPIAMSRFGQEQFAHAGLEALYVPHGVDSAFKPLDRAESREILGIPEDAFVVGMNANNKASGEWHRKGYGEAFHGFAGFAQSHSDALLYVHAEMTGAAKGWDLPRLARGFGIERQVAFTDQFQYRFGQSVDWMAAMYSAFDVFLNPALGEGFGIPIVEAQACGVPVIVTDFTAMPELVGDGWTVPGQLVWHEVQQAFWKVANIGHVRQALTEAYDRGGARSTKAAEFASGFYADRVFADYWMPVLDILGERIAPMPVAL